MNVKLQNKIVQMSKFTLFGLFLQCMLFSVILANDGYGQESELKDIHVSFNLENATIEDAFVEIESLTTFKFAYKKSAIKKRTKISNNFEDQPLDEILLSLASSSTCRPKSTLFNMGPKRNPENCLQISLNSLLTSYS